MSPQSSYSRIAYNRPAVASPNTLPASAKGQPPAITKRLSSLSIDREPARVREVPAVSFLPVEAQALALHSCDSRPCCIRLCSAGSVSMTRIYQAVD
jgi:hypothetical protein